MESCLFCSIIAGDTVAHVVLDEPEVFGFLDARPVFKGHVLVVPREHQATMTDLSPSLLATLFGTVQRVWRPFHSRSGNRDLRGREQHRQPIGPACSRPRGPAHEG